MLFLDYLARVVFIQSIARRWLAKRQVSRFIASQHLAKQRKSVTFKNENHVRTSHFAEKGRAWSVKQRASRREAIATPGATKIVRATPHHTLEIQQKAKNELSEIIQQDSRPKPAFDAGKQKKGGAPEWSLAYLRDQVVVSESVDIPKKPVRTTLEAVKDQESSEGEIADEKKMYGCKRGRKKCAGNERMRQSRSGSERVGCKGRGQRHCHP